MSSVPIQIERFRADQHLADAVSALLAVRCADPNYPPPRDADATKESFTRWLLQEEPLARWVAIEGGTVVGFVQLVAAHEYLTKHLEQWNYDALAPNGFVEISKLFVAPDRQRRGIGAQLLASACALAWSMERQPALAVVVTSQKALDLYEEEGMRVIGTFFGIHGENRVMVDEQR